MVSKHDITQVKVDVQIVVTKGAILGRVEHFQQRTAGVATPILANFVNLIQYEDRVACPSPLNGLDDAAWHGADVGPAMAADFRFVAHTAQTHADELTPQGPCDALAQAGLANPGWASKAENSP